MKYKDIRVIRVIRVIRIVRVIRLEMSLYLCVSDQASTGSPRRKYTYRERYISSGRDILFSNTGARTRRTL